MANHSNATTHGPVFCEPDDRPIFSRGIFLGENPLEYPLPLLLLQLGLITYLSAAFRFLLKPFRQPNYVSDILGGIVLGPSFLGHSEKFYKMFFQAKSVMVLDVCELLGIIFFTFLVGLRADVAVMKKGGRLALVIGLTSFVLPMILNKILAVVLVKSHVKMDEVFQDSLSSLTYLESMMNFHAMYSILTDLKLLNSELGRLALSSSMISTICGFLYWVVMKCVGHAKEGLTMAVIGTTLSRLFMVAVIMWVCRPMMFWMIRRTPEGKTLKESYVCTINLMLLGSALYCEVAGIGQLFSSVLLGMATPGSSSLGSGLVDKLESFVSAVLLPSFIVNLGRKVNFYQITRSNFRKVELFIIFGDLGKLVGTMVPSLYCNIPVIDAFLIGLLLCCQGFVDFQVFSHALHLLLIYEESFSIMVIVGILKAAIITPLVRGLYDPSRRYLAYKRRTIQHSRRNAELQILACVHQEDDVPTVINILHASNPNRESPIGVYVLELVELVGGAMPLLINHRLDKMTSSNTRTNRILRAFHQYEIRNQGVVTMHCFTSIAPFSTIHDDIRSLALEKIASLVIIPFHRADGPAVRTMQREVLERAPCSVGILVNQGMLKASRTMSESWFTLHVCVIFLGGPDDREALAYGSRMAEHPNIMVTVIRIIDVEHEPYDLLEAKQDLNAVSHFKIIHMDNNRAVYKEEGVTEGLGTAEVIQSLNEGFDLMLVGRRHDDNSPIFVGLSEWCEIRELGIVGDMLISSDFKSKASVLVVQQNASVEEDRTQVSIQMSTQNSQSNNSRIADRRR